MTLDNASAQFDTPGALDQALDLAIEDASKNTHGHPRMLKIFAAKTTEHELLTGRECMESDAIKRVVADFPVKWEIDGLNGQPVRTCPSMPRHVVMPVGDLTLNFDGEVETEEILVAYERVGFAHVRGVSYVIYGLECER